MSEAAPDTNFDGYLSYLHIEDGKCLINGRQEYAINLPKRLSVRTLESQIYKGCENFNLDYVSSDTVHKSALDAIADYRRKNDDGGKETAERQSLQATKAQEALELVKANCRELFLDQHRTAYLEMARNERVEALPVRSGRFRNWLCLQYYKEGLGMIGGEDVTNVCNVLEAEAIYSGNQRTLHLRVGGDINETMYYDLTNPEFEAIKLTASGWSKQHAPIIFAHYSNQLPQVNPLRQYDVDIFERFLSLTNLKTEDDRLLLKCYIVSLFIPGFPKPVLMLHGEQGSAKSTLQELIKTLVDPSSIKLLSFPRDVNELVQQLAHRYVAYFDNLSYIKGWISDELCKAVTGGGFSKRRLYSDDDDIAYSFMRCIGFNGINLAASKPDLLERGLIIQLERIPKERRRKINNIWREFESLRPQLLGYIFDLIVKVMQSIRQGGIELKEHPRMADWSEISEIISRCMGNPDDAFLEAYYRNIGLQTEEAISANPIAQCIGKLVEKQQTGIWVGSVTTLLEELETIATTDLKMNVRRLEGWSKAPNALSRRLNEVATNLREVGIIIDRIHDPSTNIRMVQIRKLSPESPESPTSTGSSGDTAGDIQENKPESQSTSQEPKQEQIGDAGDTGDMLHGSQYFGGEEDDEEPLRQKLVGAASAIAAGPARAGTRLMTWVASGPIKPTPAPL